MRKNILTILLSAILIATPALAKGTYVIGMPYLNAEKGTAPKIEALITEMYSRANLSVFFKHFPGLRDLNLANSGVTDGSGIRTLHAIKNYSNLTNIPTPIATANFSAFSKSKEYTITTPKDLQNLTVGVVRGEIMPCSIAYKHAKQVHAVNSYESLLALLEKKRVDIIMMESTLAGKLIKQKGTRGIIESAPLVSTKLYHIINTKHSHRIMGKLNKSLKEMILDGTAKQIFGQYKSMILSASQLSDEK